MLENLKVGGSLNETAPLLSLSENCVLSGLGDPEFNHSFGGDLDLFAGLGVTADASLAVG